MFFKVIEGHKLRDDRFKKTMNELEKKYEKSIDEIKVNTMMLSRESFEYLYKKK